MSDVRRNYELAFHINQNLEESRIMTIANELKDELTKGGATITFTKEPERQRLSYEIKHNAGSFFGYIQFNMPAGEDDIQHLTGVEEYIKLNNDILRSLILRLPSDAQKSQALERQMKARERLEKRAQATTKATPTDKPSSPSSADREKLEKAVEDIIEKL
ncbi:MAG: 30S ribosomal protein S6 [Patescibacteria group bacterium]